MNTLSDLCVLLVEDHSFQLNYLNNCMTQLGIKNISQASDGQHALESLDLLQKKGIEIDLVICDLQMPNMDGIAFIRHLEKRKFKGGIIILSAMEPALISSVSKMVAEFDLHFIGALHKPIDTKTLITYVNEAREEKNITVSRPLPDGIDEQQIIDALNSGGLNCYFQPKYDFLTREMVGIEALARLKLANGSIVAPDNFIYLYSKLNKTREFELEIYSQAIALVGKLIQLGKPLQVSLNFCANMLGNTNFYESLLGLAEQFSVPNDLITVEITERSLFKDEADSIEFLARLRMNGFKLAIDDFGTGYSSIKQLELLPFNELKIDKSFLIGLDKDGQKQAIVQSIVDLSKRLSLSIVAEGVETENVFELAKNYGCDVCQGYLTGRPMPEDDILELIQQ